MRYNELEVKKLHTHITIMFFLGFKNMKWLRMDGKATEDIINCWK